MAISENTMALLRQLEKEVPNKKDWNRLDKGDPRLIAIRNSMGLKKEKSGRKLDRKRIVRHYDLFDDGRFIKRYESTEQASTDLGVSLSQIRRRAQKAIVFDGKKTLVLVADEFGDPGREETPGDRIRKLRIENDLTQAELGELIGYAKVTIGKIERGEYFPIDVVKKIAKALGVTMIQLLEEEN